MPLKTTEDGFLEKCDDQERPYFEQIIRYLEEQNISYEMGTKGISVRDQNNKGVVYLFPTGTVRSIQIRSKDLSADKISSLKERLKAYQIDSLSFKPSQVPVETLVEMLDIIMN